MLLGTPAEEAGGGKVLMLEAGAFDDIAAAVMLHPGPLDIAARPFAGAVAGGGQLHRARGARRRRAVSRLNAADAITVAQVAIGLLRQQLAPGQMMHGIVTDGGQATNVIPAHAEMHYTMRANDSGVAARAGGQDVRLFPGRRGRHRLRATVAEATEPAYHELTPGPVAGRRVPREMVRLGRTPVGAEVEAALPLGSTDMGNVTQVMPGIHPIVGIDAGGASMHQPAFAARRGRPERRQGGHRGGDHAGPHRRRRSPRRRRSAIGCWRRSRRARVMSLARHTDAWLAAHYDDLVAWRRHIHTHPELGRQEFATTQFVASHLADAGPQPEGAARRNRPDL